MVKVNVNIPEPDHHQTLRELSTGDMFVCEYNTFIKLSRTEVDGNFNGFYVCNVQTLDVMLLGMNVKVVRLPTGTTINFVQEAPCGLKVEKSSS